MINQLKLAFSILLLLFMFIFKYILLVSFARSVRQFMDRVFFLPFMAQARSARAMNTRKEKDEAKSVSHVINTLNGLNTASQFTL